MKDAYKSLIEALSHGGIANKVKVNLDWIESEVFEKEDPAPFLEHVNGILVPGGFGQRGAWDTAVPDKQRLFQHVAATTPARRVGQPSDVSSAARALLTNPFITGETLHVDGGGRWA